MEQNDIVMPANHPMVNPAGNGQQPTALPHPEAASPQTPPTQQPATPTQPK
jgi:hypothetical protein